MIKIRLEDNSLVEMSLEEFIEYRHLVELETYEIIRLSKYMNLNFTKV